MSGIVIDWMGFKRWKQEFKIDPLKYGNLNLILLYLKRSHRSAMIEDLYDALMADSLGRTMLEKKGVTSADGLFPFMNVQIDEDYY